MSDFLDSPIKCVHNNTEHGYSFTKSHTVWRWFLFPEMIWHFSLNQLTPLIIELENGTQIKPNFEFDTNLGSIPLPFRALFPKDEFPVCYALHDDEYNRHGIYVKAVGMTEFTFCHTTRKGADNRLKANIITVGGGSKARASTIRRAVRIGGALPWSLGEVREKKGKANA
jgi:hypothetical protein